MDKYNVIKNRVREIDRVIELVDVIFEKGKELKRLNV